jgi:hypothetical protein
MKVGTGTLSKWMRQHIVPIVLASKKGSGEVWKKYSIKKSSNGNIIELYNLVKSFA